MCLALSGGHLPLYSPEIDIASPLAERKNSLFTLNPTFYMCTALCSTNQNCILCSASPRPTITWIIRPVINWTHKGQRASQPNIRHFCYGWWSPQTTESDIMHAIEGGGRLCESICQPYKETSLVQQIWTRHTWVLTVPCITGLCTSVGGTHRNCWLSQSSENVHRQAQLPVHSIIWLLRGPEFIKIEHLIFI